jgi:adenylate kinase
VVSEFGAKSKLVILGPVPSDRDSSLRSLNLIEHVSPASLLSPGISRSAPAGPSVGKADPVAAMRRWFWSRKPDAGFLLQGFPATLLQAMILDEWLDARNEALDAIILGDENSLGSALAGHYRRMGIPLVALAAGPSR